MPGTEQGPTGTSRPEGPWLPAERPHRGHLRSRSLMAHELLIAENSPPPGAMAALPGAGGCSRPRVWSPGLALSSATSQRGDPTQLLTSCAQLSSLLLENSDRAPGQVTASQPTDPCESPGVAGRVCSPRAGHRHKDTGCGISPTPICPGPVTPPSARVPPRSHLAHLCADNGSAPSEHCEDGIMSPMVTRLALTVYTSKQQHI